MFERYWHLCPDFVIEVRSQTDRWRTLREKMREWIDNGAQLAVGLIIWKLTLWKSTGRTVGWRY